MIPDDSKMKKINDEFFIDMNETLGKGNFGVVYKGYQASTNQIIAVKFVPKKMLLKFPDYQRQINVMKDLAKYYHPNIMGYYGFVENQDGLYCFIELCKGGSLKEKLTEKFSELKVLSLLRQILDAMTYINGQNKVHRDLKPDNLLLDENMELKIADFGLARDVQTQMTKGVCTPLYAAPEVLTLQPYNEKCDVWSAGSILYEMLTGKELFAHIKKKKDLLKEVEKFANEDYDFKLPKHLHPEWKKLIKKMMTHSDKKRPSFKELKQDFKVIEEEMRNDLMTKYGGETQEQKDFEHELRLTKKISPYQSNPKKEKNNLADMAQRLREQRSFMFIHNLGKYIHFYRSKNEILVKIIKQFNATTYGCLKNVYKFILMFLSVSAYISRLTTLVNELNSKRISTPDGIITVQSILESHLPQFEELLKQSAAKIGQAVNKYKLVLSKQIIAKILGTYMQRPEEKNIIEGYDSLLNLLEKAKVGEFVEQEAYMSMFQKIIAKEGYLPMNVVKQLKTEDLRAYMFLRLIGNLETIIKNSSYKNDDYLRVKKQHIENASKEENLQFVSKFN